MSAADTARDQASPEKNEQPANLTNEVRDISRHPVGFGGFSDIYTAIWESAEGEKKVALKVLRVRAMDAASKKMLRQLLREISVWKRLAHPNIHLLYGLYDGIGPAPAMVSPWWKNGDINNYIANRENDPEIDGLKLKLFVQVMAGLRFLHDHFIIHGDIKGGNVLISDDGVAQLCDFGLSRLLWGSTQSISHTGGRGTLHWMAPELVLDGEVHSYESSHTCTLGEVTVDGNPVETRGRNCRNCVSSFRTQL
ncbi:kinase-like protein [Exidia glandulosa HHB12029]|uniref:Kinase-like protein n=1 Tax=Exidia glandulosa HHB12029 TaxID=1314781 RepID=A0A165MXA9_EXIGL|nr:kinase-like protein [Exidia glandulosa HHB12029]